MAGSASVSLVTVSKVFPGGVQAVDGFSLDIDDGEFLVLVGPSGCGKSTVLRMIAGLETPTSGEVRIGGRLCNLVEPKDRDIAMVFQSYALYPHMTVRENLEFGLKLGGQLTRVEIETRVQEAAEILEIGTLLDRKPRQLSGGQRQRVALGRAIVRKPKVFLFDEPLSNLDAKMRIQMRVELGRLHSRLQTTMIYVTHDQTEAMTMGDRIVCMKDGRIQQVGKPMGLYNHPINDYVASFIGTPPMNFMECALVDQALQLPGGSCLPLGAKEKEAMGDATKIRLGVRPEHLEIASGSEGAIPVIVEVVEPLGSETLVYASGEGASLTIRTRPEHHPDTGERLWVRPLAGHMHFFDVSSGRNMLTGLGA